MALIKCAECGKEISDRAGACPNCGCPIEKKIVCSECGKEFSDKEKSCPNCGCPIENNKTNYSGGNVSNLNSYHIESNKNVGQIDTFCLGGMITGIISFFIDFFGLVSAVALVISIIGFTRANSKSKTYAIIGMVCSGIELILKFIQLVNLMSL